jgi:8-oxo-dGTP pyrophosphatase MutT (NUDIX family)
MPDHATEIRPAATAIVLRDGPGATGLEVLMLKRAAQLTFFGGAWVFPGGRVDPEDGDLVNALPDAARIAAGRELFEEAGLRVDPKDLTYFARWITPPGRPRRFDTFYFAVPAPLTEVVLDARESDEFRWIRPEAALEARTTGEMELPPPTFVTLSELARLTDVSTACVTLTQRKTEYVPRPCEVEGGMVYLYDGDAGYGARDPNTPGARHRLTAVNGVWRYERS